MRLPTPRALQIGGRPARRHIVAAGLRELAPTVRSMAVALLLLAVSGPALAQVDPWDGMEGDPLLPRASGHARPPSAYAGSRAEMTAGWLSPMSSPRVAKDVPPQIYQAFVRAHALASEQVRSKPACRDLFSALNADGSRILSETYYLRYKTQDLGFCSSGVAAYTHVHDHRCWLCPRFAGLSVSAGAMILIHEALHSAGLPEDPRSEVAFNSFGINRLVHQSCLRD